MVLPAKKVVTGRLKVKHLHVQCTAFDICNTWSDRTAYQWWLDSTAYQ